MRRLVVALLATWVLGPAPAHADECASMFIATSDIEHCRSVMAHHSALRIQDTAARDGSAARSMTLSGAVLLALGGAGMMAVLVDGSVEVEAARANRVDGYMGLTNALGAGFAAASTVALTGAILMAVGVRRGAKARQEQRFLSARW